MTLKPCVECGEVTNGSRCPQCRGYSNNAWTRLSKRARRAQPFCSDCGSVTDLQCDHLPSAWERRAQRKPLRLKDVDVVCGECNRLRGSSRPEQTGGMPPTRGFPRPPRPTPNYTPGVCK